MPAARLVRWFENFEARHGSAAYDVLGGALSALAADGSTAQARLPLDQAYDGPATPPALAGAARLHGTWGILLVRRGGFAVARLDGARLVAHKVGQRHVQGRTRAGGRSQQRFARRRANQARAAYEAAADHAARILTLDVRELVTGGDRAAVDEVLGDRRLAHVAGRRTSGWFACPDPTRRVLDDVIGRSSSVTVTVHNAAVSSEHTPEGR